VETGQISLIYCEKNMKARMNYMATGNIELTYTERDGLLYPNITPPQSDGEPLSKYGSLHQKYLKKANPVKYQSLILDGELPMYLRKIDGEAKERYFDIKEQLEKNAPKPPSGDTMAVIRYHRRIADSAEEIVLIEIVYQA
jgi:hypothetical protein